MKLYDVVTLLENVPEQRLYRGQVGTLIEQYQEDIFEVEFSDLRGHTYALATLNANQLLVLHHEVSELELEKFSE